MKFKSLLRKKKIKYFLILIFLLSIILILNSDHNNFILNLKSGQINIVKVNNLDIIFLSAGNLKFNFKNSNGFYILSNQKGHPISITSLSNLNYIFLFHDFLTLNVSNYKLESKDSSSECYNILWSQPSSSGNFIDIVYLNSSYWYGGSLMESSTWPLNKYKHKLKPFVTGDAFNSYYGSIQERFWLSSSGLALFVDYNVPLFVDINSSVKGFLQLKSQFSSPYSNSKNYPLTLNYTICQSSSTTDMFLHSASHFWTKPPSIPFSKLFVHPIWSTWVAFKWSLSEKVLMDYINKIINFHSTWNHLVIDDGWMDHYGDFELSPSKFPDGLRMMDKIKSLNFSTSLWVHPFSSISSSSIWKKDPDGESIWVKGQFRSLPSFVFWWNGLGAILDLTSNYSCNWFASELKQMMTRYHIDSLKFDAGESTWLPSFSAHFKKSLDNPNDYTQKFVEIAMETDLGENMQELRTSVSKQHVPLFLRLIDKHSRWGESNGLISIIPQILTVGLLGYPFVIPDMVGGNGYLGIFIHFTIKPEKELYIRWLQLVTLMPAVQFSVGPWDFDSEVVEISKKMISLHLNFSNVILDLAKLATISGEPIIRPIWWNEKKGFSFQEERNLKEIRKKLFNIDDEFLLGNNILVAPIVTQGARSRMVLFPEGSWKRGLIDGKEDLSSVKIYKGYEWYEISVPLDNLAFFIRI